MSYQILKLQQWLNGKVDAS